MTGMQFPETSGGRHRGPHSPHAEAATDPLADSATSEARRAGWRTFFTAKRGDGVRHDLEGLRAIAVLGVVVYHLRASWLPGGFAGVDVFFVLSGFFITGLVLREIDRTGTVSLLKFWGRRARRLLPASALVIVATVVAGYAMTNPLEAQRIGKDGFFAAVFGMNWRSAFQKTQYLQDPNPSPFVHYWSLGVEEQFYIGWPLLLLALALLWRLARRRAWAAPRVMLVVVSVALGVASFLTALAQTRNDNSYAYFGTFERVWQLALGGLCAVVVLQAERLPQLLLAASRWVGVALVIAFYVGASTDILYPGRKALIPAVGAALIILAGEPKWRRWDPLSWVLCSWPAQLGGRYSYSWYLWHYPPLVLLAVYLDRPLRIRELLLCAVGTFVAAVLTYHLLENPVRKNGWLAARRGGRSLALGALLVALGVGAAQGMTAAATHDAEHTGITNARGQVLTPQPAQAAADFPRVYADGCVQGLQDPDTDLPTGDAHAPDCRYLPNTGHGDIVLTGDSHAAMWFPAVLTMAEQHKWGLTIYSRNSCPFADVTKDIGRVYTQCDAFRKKVMAKLLATRPGLVIVGDVDSSFSPIYARDSRGRPTTRQLTGKAEVAAYTTALAKNIRILRKAGIRVLVLGDTPGYPVDMTGPDCVLQHPKDLSACSLPQVTARPPYNANLKAALRVGGVSTIDFTKVFCRDQRCYQVIGHILAYRDQNHLTTPMTQLLRPALEPVVADALAGKVVHVVVPASAGRN